MSPSATFTVVVLPAPFGPRSPYTSLVSTVRSTPLRISTGRRRKPTRTVLCRPQTASAGAAVTKPLRSWNLDVAVAHVPARVKPLQPASTVPRLVGNPGRAGVAVIDSVAGDAERDVIGAALRCRVLGFLMLVQERRQLEEGETLGMSGCEAIHHSLSPLRSRPLQQRARSRIMQPQARGVVQCGSPADTECPGLCAPPSRVVCA